MLLICTDASRRDLRALDDCTMDMEFGDGGGDANTFELLMRPANASASFPSTSRTVIDQSRESATRIPPSGTSASTA